MPPGNDAIRARLAAQEAQEARDAAVKARQSADHAREDAEQARDSAIRSADADGGVESAPEPSPAIADELLIHPDDVPDVKSDDPFGTPGPPISRRAAFYVGFTATLGALLAIAVGLALKQVSSVIVLVLVAVFLAVGLNPLVEWLITAVFNDSGPC